MNLRFSDDIETYAAAVTAYLEAEPCSNNVLRWIIELARQGGEGWNAAPGFWWGSDGGEVVCAASYTPPFGVHVSELPAEACAPLVHAVEARRAALGTPVGRVVGPKLAAHRFAEVWSGVTGLPAREHMAQLLHECSAVTEVPAPSGERRRAVSADVDPVLALTEAFIAETGVPAAPDLRAWTHSRIEQGLLYLWTVTGDLVSMTGRAQAVAGVVRVGPVYTPPEHRNRGYARRLVAEVTAEALATPGVHHCMLYTDATNPVSNSIYRQAGYRPREEHADIVLG